MSLRELRLKRGMTQQQLADKIGVTQQRIASFETGQRPIGGMSLDVALRFCDALKISNPRKLLDDSEPSKEQVSDR
ncbi:helix-turn-helix transcriptional regulator [Bifidobacterium simiarum]|uniref:helix-turn-helix transcriptional regulator n=1 Tax=Bifidobacterium simiarum TaxID=2045441 RepID=UPI001BDD7506|nr:helix-turn-helix transcriptional regulator [Bifidobacterium simiarum]MBT1166231.1 helix-turn-helix transcriptional regulator [Bifidobacterium simiarum]